MDFHRRWGETSAALKRIGTSKKSRLLNLDSIETNVGWGLDDPSWHPQPAVPAKREAKRSWRESDLSLGEVRRLMVEFGRLNYAGFDIPQISGRELAFRHSGWKSRRDKILAAMVRNSLPIKRIERFTNCGASCIVQRSPSTKKVRCLACLCHDRWCIPCQRARSHRLAAVVADHMEGKDCRFVTLTLRHRQAPLKDQIDRLLRCFRNLRAMPFWAEKVLGGAAFVEIKRSRDGRAWHPHLHLIVEGKYLPESVLSQKWLVVTGDSHVVDVRRVNSREHAARYVSKYCSTPIDDGICTNSEWLDEAMIALRGSRLCTTFGSWRGLVLEPKKDDPGDWIKICSLDALMAAVENAEPWAIALHARLTGRDSETASRDPPGSTQRADQPSTLPLPF
jgi:hypothetical protein